MRTLSRVGKLAGVIAVATAAAAGITIFLTASASTPPPPEADSTPSDIQPPQTPDYWTPERMRNAKPAPMPSPDVDEAPPPADP